MKRRTEKKAVAASRRKPLSTWVKVFAASVVLGFLLLSHTIDRTSDADDAMMLYEGGMRSWHDVFVMTFLPPGHFEVTPTPESGIGKIPSHPVYVYARWRPFSSFLATKTLWALDLTARGYKVVNWVIYAGSCWAFAWGLFRIFSLFFPLAPDALWILATLIFWSPPALFTATGPMYIYWTQLFCGIAFALMTNLGTGRERWAKSALCALLLFLSCQDAEQTWVLLTWLGVWLAGLQYLGMLKRDHPRPWWPIAIVAVVVLGYRSFSNPDHIDWTLRGGNSIDWLWKNVSYLVMATFNGLADPLPHWLGMDEHPLDVYSAEPPIAFALTLAAGWLAFFRNPHYRAPPPKIRRAWHWSMLGLAVTAVISTAPFWLVRGHRFVHYTVQASQFLAVAIALACLRTKKLFALPVILLLAASILTSAQYVLHYNWIEYNAGYTMNFTRAVLNSDPQFKECTADSPCCVTMSHGWSHNEWVLDWNAGTFKRPAFVPEGWPGVTCARHLVYNQ